MKDSKNVLMIASMASMLANFNKSNITILQTMGYKVTLAANFLDEDSNSKKRNESFRIEMKQLGCNIVQIDFSRKILNIKKQLKSYKQVKKLLTYDFNLVHCHSPICAAITRIVFRKKRKKGTKIIYTAHGFHFFRDSSKINWLFYYPIEKICSYFTDCLITINHEDYMCAKKKLRAQKVVYIPGVGVDLEKFELNDNGDMEKSKLYDAIEHKAGEIVLLSVGELNDNKNHKIVIKALANLPDLGFRYIIAGKGEKERELRELIHSFGMDKRVHLLGFRDDVDALYKAADIFVLPSLREGLSLALMEAMACGLPIICSNIRGNKDLVTDGINGFLCNCQDIDAFSQAIYKLYRSTDLRITMGRNNLKKIENYSKDKINDSMRRVYREQGRMS